MNKKVVIARVAFVEKCSCGIHGHIAFPDGSYSYEFFSRDEGLEEIAECLQEGLMEEDEAGVLREEIKKWKFIDDLILPEVHRVMNILSESNHPPEATERIIAAIYDVADQAADRYLSEENMLPTEENTQEEKRVLH